jgi:hypothetical protein
VVAVGNIIDTLQNQGGKRFHLDLLKQGGFSIPETFSSDDLGKLPNSRLYIVRSSAAGEDGHTKTSAGRYTTIKGVGINELESVVNEVRLGYTDGSVVIQPDLSDAMEFSGVAYSNLNGSCMISCGRGSIVQQIVEGELPETEIITTDRQAINGSPINPRIAEKIHKKSIEVEEYFGIPMDIEFAVINNEVILLQARPLPNPTDSALREHEIRRARKALSHVKDLDEIVLGVGNYREILGNTDATHLSTSTFNHIFSGDGKILGGMQLGRNELGYDVGTEIFPWVIMLDGKVYYNFCGDALQFRPSGIKKEDMLRIVNEVYLPIVRGDPDLLNYPELRLYIQFPEQAEQVGLDPEPFRKLAEKNRMAIGGLVIPKVPPLKIFAKEYDSLDECLTEIHLTVDGLRTGSAREYAKAARLAFFALEDVRFYIEQMEEPELNEIVKLFGKKSPEQLRDAVVYDESIGSFVAEGDEYAYLGSFELSKPRGLPPKRNFRKGRELPEKGLAELVKKTRMVLEYREKVKFTLFRDYDYLKQLYEQAGRLSGFGEDIFYLEYNEIDLLNEPVLAMYRTELRKQIRGKALLSDPIFESDLASGIKRGYDKKPQLVFGSLPENGISVVMGVDGYIVDSVDQTIEIPEETRIVVVPDNVRPGSHLFTLLSDYALPVVGVPQSDLDGLRGKQIEIVPNEGYVEVKK